jgi:hypothetical protein
MECSVRFYTGSVLDKENQQASGYSFSMKKPGDPLLAILTSAPLLVVLGMALLIFGGILGGSWLLQDSGSEMNISQSAFIEGRRLSTQTSREDMKALKADITRLIQETDSIQADMSASESELGPSQVALPRLASEQVRATPSLPLKAGNQAVSAATSITSPEEMASAEVRSQKKQERGRI